MLLFWVLTLLQPLSVRAIPLDTSVGSPPPNRYLKRNLPIPAIADPHREGYQPVGSTIYSVTIQTPTPISNTNPNTLGFVVTSLETAGRTDCGPLLTNPIPSPTSLLVPAEPSEPSVNMPTEQAKPTSTASSNIFGAPIATTKPSPVFQERKDHPVPRLGIKGPGPYGTNKFYANFFLGSQTSPAFVHPYSLAWSKGNGSTSSWGMSISHTEANQRVYGDVQPETGAAKYFLNPIGIQSLCLSASELGSSTALTTDSINSHSANVNLHVNSDAKPLITFPLVQGMGFVTAVYTGGTPVIETGVFFKIVTRSSKGPHPGVTKYTLYLEDGKVWHVYAYSAKGDPFDLTVTNNHVAKAGKPFNGIVQVAKDPGNAESIIDAASGAYPVGMVLSGTSSGSKGTYTFSFQKAGYSNAKLLMYALPHHYESFDNVTTKATSTVRLQTTTKGMAKAVIADSWTMAETNMPVSMGFAPWDPVKGPRNTLSDSAVKTITPVALKELSQNMDQQSNQDSMYFSGKV